MPKRSIHRFFSRGSSHNDNGSTNQPLNEPTPQRTNPSTNKHQLQSRNLRIVHFAAESHVDRRYAIDNHNIQTELGWQPQFTVETGLAQTVAWSSIGKTGESRCGPIVKV
jgi:nucleoside-diphosphate-sugar epimerase